MSQVPLGIMLLNENKLSEMCKIMESLQRYVPAIPDIRTFDVCEKHVRVEDSKFCDVLFGGDQLTVARTRGAAAIRSSHDTTFDRLEGLVPVIEDWHARVALVKVPTFNTL